MQQKHILFASYEIHPITAGGCGVFIWHAINELLETTNHKITLLLDIPKFECEAFINNHKGNIPNHERLNVVCLSDRIPWEFLPMEAFNNIFMFKSYMFYKVIETLTVEEQIDYIEFFDYVGIGYFTIHAKKYERQFANTLLGVRGHCTVDLMDLEQCQHDFSKEKIEMYEIEKLALQNADIVLVQTEAWKPLYAVRYGIEEHKIIVAEPPMNTKDFPKYEPHTNQNVLFYGRVFQLKGIDEYVQAGIHYLLTYPENQHTKFYIVGYDGTTQEGTSYTENLQKQIPEKLRERFIFTGKLDRSQLKEILNDIAIAVFPNYVESFCYSIHEIYEAGVPIICREIPAFTSYFKDQVNCLTYDGGIQVLANKIHELLTTKDLQQKFRYPMKVLKGIPQQEIYSSLLERSLEQEDTNLVPEQISIVCMSQSSQVGTFMEQIPKTLRDAEFISPKSYIIYTQSELIGGENLEKIQFLGWEVFVQSQGECVNMPLEPYVLIMKQTDQVHLGFVRDAMKVLAQTDLDYVSGVHNVPNRGITYPKYHILQNEYAAKPSIETMLINTKKVLNLKELFDFRYGSLGQLGYLQKQGYSIVRNYQQTFEALMLDDTQKSNLIFALNNSKRDEEWKPEDLISLLEPKKEELPIYNKRKAFYHETKRKLYASDAKSAKVLLKGLDTIKEIYCSINR